MLDNKFIQIIKDELGIEELPESNFKQINEMASWYAGKVDSFHTYRLYNGENKLELEKKSLQMPKKVCEDWSDCLANEKLEITLKSKEDTEILNQIFKSNKFRTTLSNGVEKSFALGYGALLPQLVNLKVGENSGFVTSDKDTKIKINFIDATKIVPISFEDGKLVECAFVSSNTRITTIVICAINNENGNYDIINMKFNNKDLANPIEKYTFPTESNMPPFMIIKPNININTFSQDLVGISIYANSIDTFKTIDDIFDSFDNEFLLSRKKLFLAADMYDVQITENGEGVKYNKHFDPYSDVFYKISNKVGEGEDVKSFNDEIRTQALVDGLNTALNILSKQVGFGTQRYKFEPSTMQTATGVKSANQDLALSMQKHSNLLAEELTSLIMYVKFLTNKYNLAYGKFSDFSETDIIINFDDSVIEDNGTKMERDKADVQAKLMSPIEYRMKWYGEDEETATKNYNEYFKYDLINKYLPALNSGAMTPEAFAKKIYGDNVEQEVINYITEKANKNSTSFNDFITEE